MVFWYKTKKIENRQYIKEQNQINIILNMVAIFMI